VASLTPFQTVGPYLSLGLQAGLAPLAASPEGPAIVVRGRLFDGGGNGIPDGVLEWWHPALPWVRRSPTGADGSFSIQTIKPPTVTGPNGAVHASHLAVRVLGRGILTHYVTRLYFPDEGETSADPVLNAVPPHRRATLIARRESAHEYRFDVVIQGENETVFFDI
jgi:protocatechuate 3,4-dioxygenase, alpha subunit